MKTSLKLMVALTILALAGGSARAANQYWTNDLSGGVFTSPGKWMSGTVPGAPDYVYFTNNATPASIYTVQFTVSQTNNVVRVLNDSVRFDMNGFYWWSTNGTLGNMITSAAPQKVVFSSSTNSGARGVAGNLADWGAGSAFNNGTGNSAQQDKLLGSVDLFVDDSLGYGVKLRWGGGTGQTLSPASLTVSGPGSEFEWGSLNIGGLDTVTVVSNGATFNSRTWHGQAVVFGTTYLDQATFRQGGDWLTLGGTHQDRARMYISNGGTLVTTTGPGLAIGGVGYAGAILSLDNSTANISNALYLGSGSFQSGPGVGGYAGRLYVQNGSKVWAQNGIIFAGDGTRTNVMVLNNSRISVGLGATAGYVTNPLSSGRLYASGTISGSGTGSALFYTKGKVFVGDTLTAAGLGTLTFSNMNAVLDLGSQLNLNFSESGYDRILAAGNSLSVLGTNLFSLGPGAPAPAPGVKYGAGIFDFLVASNLTWNPQYDNLAFLLTNTYHLTYGVDFQYGVVSLPGGLFALELTFVPEPSTVLLLGLGGLLVWRRIAKGGRKRSKVGSVMIAVALILALAGNTGQAANQYWTNDLTGGNFTNTAKWMSGTVPGTPDYVYFTNNAAPASIYTVTFTKAQTNNVVRINNDSVRFNMNGYYWWGTNTTLGNQITATTGQKVIFSSSSPAAVTGGNTVDFYDSTTFGGAPATISAQDLMSGPVDVVVDDSLGYGVRFRWGGYTSVWQVPASLTVSGTNTWFEYGMGNSAGFDTVMVISNAALMDYRTYHGQVTLAYTTQVYGATFRQGADWLQIGYNNQDRARMYLNNNATLVDPVGPGVRVGGPGTAGGRLYVDNSNVGFSNGVVVVGSGATGTGAGPQLHILNGSTFYSLQGIYTTGTRSNVMVLNNSTIRVGSGATAGTVSNSVATDRFYAAGTISGNGTANAQFYTKGKLYLGDTLSDTLTSTGMAALVLNRTDARLDRGSQTYFNFSDANYDRIVATNGSLTMLGTNLFSLAPGAPAPMTGVKYGLGTYNFVLGTSTNNWTPQYDNLVNLLTNTYHLQYGVDFHYGVVDLRNGLFALELTFIPEPSTVMLLALGGLLIWRRLAKRAKK